MAFYSDDWVDEVRLRSDLVAIVSEHVALKQNGRRYIGLCPFHGEKTPSFSVDAEKQLYYCFGCHAGGNVFRFVMEIEHMDFPEAARYLAERAHIPIPEQGAARIGPSREAKDRLYAALTEAARWYHKTLYEPEGKEALAYLHGRGLGDNTIRRFGLGATAEGWERLSRSLEDKGFTRKELEDANLSVTRGDRSFDFFRARAMFPIFDPRGKVIGFGGRILSEGQPKYLNSSDTAVFNKRRNVYGLNFIKGTAQRLYLVEGYMDVVSLAQHGVTNCVATLGTALTPEQARLIRRKAGDAGEIVIVYDGDAAGQRATRRALDIFSMEGVSCKVMVIPGGQDPDDYVRAYGAQAFTQLELMTAVGYLLKGEREAVDVSTLEGRTAYATGAAKILKTVESPVEVDNYVKQLAVETGFSREVLYEQIGRTPKMRLSAQVSGNTRNQYRDTIKDRQPDYVKAQQHLVSLLAAGNAKVEVSIEDFTDPMCRELVQALLDAGADRFSASRVLDALDDEKREKAGEIFSLDESGEQGNSEELAQGYLRTVRRYALEEKLGELTDRMQQVGHAQATELYREYIEINKRLDVLKSARAQGAV